MHPEATVVYLHPFGSTQIENIEQLNSNDGPVIFCYDQEPLLADYNRKLFQHIKDTYAGRPIVLLNTERTSQEKNRILDEFGFIDCNYFFHGLAAADWYRGYRYCAELVAPSERTIEKKYITFNRLTGGARAYRSFLVAELAQRGLLDKGYVSYSDTCPDNGIHYEQSILATYGERGVSAEYIIRARYALDRIQYPLRIDNAGAIPNGSYILGARQQLMSSFLHVVTETCFWEGKTHLTEKIFKPIVARQPFVLLGCTFNLRYLRSYGFQTFDHWWNESYDVIVDPIDRLKAVVDIIQELSSMSDSNLKAVLHSMRSVLDHNYNLFYSQNFVNKVWFEMTTNLNQAVSQATAQL